MNEQLEPSHHQTFDVIVVGAGISGAFLAWELSRRNIKVALVEQSDFGGSTSAASSKLLHGGIRYLQQLQFSKVYESARERARFINLAPNIPSYIPFVVPTYDTGLMKSRLVLQSGMALYDFICTLPNRKIVDPSKKVPKGFYYKKPTLLKKLPLLKDAPGLSGGQFFYEAHMHSSERMTMELVKLAKANGASVMNYTKVNSFIGSETVIHGVNCINALTNEEFSINAQVVVNAAGPFIPMLSNESSQSLFKPTTGYSKGMHLVTRQLDENYAMALVTKMKSEAVVSRGGRHIFIIPWRGRSLIGTTNEPFDSDDLNVIPITEKEIEIFIEEINSALPSAKLERTDVYYAYSGLYPLISDEVKTDTYQGTGEYQVVDHYRQSGIEGVVTVMGAKYTTAGKVAKQAVDVLLPKLKDIPPINGSLSEVPDQWLGKHYNATLVKLQNQYQSILPPQTIEHLVINYGLAAVDVIQRVENDAKLGDKLADVRENIIAELYYCIENEWVCHLDDFIFRRTGLGTIGHPGRSCLERCTKILQAKKGWSDTEAQNEMERVERRYRYDS